MILQAITVAVNYSDFLSESMKENVQHFDKWVVVTTPDDTKTQEVCRQYDKVVCITTDSFYRDGAAFAKHNGYNLALPHIDADAFVLFIDADIVLQPETHMVLELLELEKGVLYGMDRFNCIGYEHWRLFKEGRTEGLVAHYCMVSGGPFPMMGRLAHRYIHKDALEWYEGYLPLGYFQLTHRSSFRDYPGTSHDAAGSDVDFSRMFSRRNRRLIPELVCIHLDSIRSEEGANWSGRTTPAFLEPNERDE